ncbi:MAG: radical SAM protein [Candidatus Omnitrophica bacterium]|nr:radical SAM protein [Candidatus Omnitrophota bacterium]
MKVLILSPGNKRIKNVVRDLVYGCWCAGRRIGGTQMPPLNLLYVATILKDSGHNIKFVDAGVDYASYEDAKKRMADFEAVIILSSTNSFKMDLETLIEIKNLNPSIKTIVFGSHSTFMPQSCLREKCIDIIIRREPEFIVRDVINALDRKENWREVYGIGYKQNGNAMLNEFYPFLNMNELPIPDRNLLPRNIDYFNPLVKRMPYTTMQTSRGCPGECNFCTVPYFYGRQVRYRIANNVIDEVTTLQGLGYKEIFFRDETFSAFKKRNKEICEKLIKNNNDVTWICNARIDLISEEDIALMKKSGCHMIKFGVESGNQQILDNIKKSITVEQTRTIFQISHKLGMNTHAHVMLGCPGETKETIQETLRFVKEIDPTTASFGIHTPYPGTELFNKVAIVHPEIKDGVEASMEKLHIKGFFNEIFTELSKEELEKCVRKAYRTFYFRLGYLLKRLFSINSFNELIRWSIAALNIFSFGVNKD